MLPNHLGGHLNKTHLDEKLLDYLIKEYKIKSMIDIGCGPGGMVKTASEKGLSTLGIDGDFTLGLKPPLYRIHDFSKERIEIDYIFDLAWSVEFLEHVEEEFIYNYMPAFQSAKIVLCTAAPPGWSGHHHVNCQLPEYWIDVFNEYGFEYLPELTDTIKNISNMKKGFIKKNGMIFKNASY